MNRIKFSKLHGQGNDFIIIDAISSEISLTKEEISRMCDRHFGIGADGLILARKDRDDCFFMDYYNSDGTVAEMCGNGIRCMARFLIDKKLAAAGKSMKINTRAGLKNIEFPDSDSKSASRDGLIKVNMGKAIFEPDRIPVNIDKKSLIDGFFAGQYLLKTEDGEFIINCVSMGNPHCVILLKDGADLEKIPLDRWGPLLENHKIFPNKTNVEFIKIKSDSELLMRVWERGVGETMACGTGACASAVCAIVLKKIKTARADVILPGGNLSIYWEGQNSPVFLEGGTGYVFEGEYFL